MTRIESHADEIGSNAPPHEKEDKVWQPNAAFFALWMARDDAHIAAWRAEGLSAPHLDLLTSLWRKEAHTLLVN